MSSSKTVQITIKAGMLVYSETDRIWSLTQHEQTVDARRIAGGLYEYTKNSKTYTVGRSGLKK